MNTTTPKTAAEWFLRIGLAVSFLSAGADRIGLWGSPGAPGVSWGDWSHFRAYSDHLNAWAPAAIRPALAWAATAAEMGLGVGLLVPYRTAWTASMAGLLLTTFAITMTFVLGPKPPLDYSVWTAAGASFLLAATARRL